MLPPSELRVFPPPSELPVFPPSELMYSTVVVMMSMMAIVWVLDLVLPVLIILRFGAQFARLMVHTQYPDASI